MQVVLIPTQKVIASGRLDFAFFNPLSEDQISLAKGSRTQRLRDICASLKTGKTASRNGYTDTGVRIIKVKNVRGDGLDWTEPFYASADFYKSARNKASVLPNDILMLCSAHVASYIGRCDIVLEMPADVLSDQGRCLAVGELIIIRPDPEKVNAEYLLAFLRLAATQEKIQRLVKGQSAHLYPVDLGELEIVLPPREQQEQVAALNRAAEIKYRDALARARQDMHAAKDSVRKLIFSQSSSVS